MRISDWSSDVCSSDLFRQCWTGAQPARRTKGGDGGTQVSWSDGCGLTIRAKAFLSGQNPGLVVDLNVAMMQQGDLSDPAAATQAPLPRVGTVPPPADVQPPQPAPPPPPPPPPRPPPPPA